jgi:predicted transcriptional regulator
MTNFLPPMTNPNTRVTQVFDNDFNDKEMKDETEVNKIEIASVKNEIVPNLEEDHFLSDVVEQSLVNNGIKVIVKRNDESFDELMETCVSGDDFNPSH